MSDLPAIPASSASRRAGGVLSGTAPSRILAQHASHFVKERIHAGTRRDESDRDNGFDRHRPRLSTIVALNLCDYFGRPQGARRSPAYRSRRRQTSSVQACRRWLDILRTQSLDVRSTPIVSGRRRAEGRSGRANSALARLSPAAAGLYAAARYGHLVGSATTYASGPPVPGRRLHDRLPGRGARVGFPPVAATQPVFTHRGYLLLPSRNSLHE